MEIDQRPAINKRLKIVYLVLSLAGLMFLSLLLPAAYAYLGISVLVLAAYGVTVVCLDRDLRREEWIVLPLYSLLATIIYYAWVSPSATTVIMALVSAVGYGVIMYGLLLTLNIINIATVRTIPLARPANTVLSLAGLVGSFGLYYLALVNQPQIINWILAVGGSTLLIAWPLTWVSQGSKLRFQRSLAWSALSALLMMQLAAVISFWPSTFSSSLILSVVLFLILGIFHLQQRRQLNLEVKRQYLILGGVAAMLFMLLSQW